MGNNKNTSNADAADRYVCYSHSNDYSVYINKELTVSNDHVCLPASQIYDNLKLTNILLSKATLTKEVEAS